MKNYDDEFFFHDLYFYTTEKEKIGLPNSISLSLPCESWKRSHGKNAGIGDVGDSEEVSKLSIRCPGQKPLL